RRPHRTPAPACRTRRPLPLCGRLSAPPPPSADPQRTKGSSGWQAGSSLFSRRSLLLASSYRGGGTDALTRVKTAQLPAGAACGGLEALRCWRSSRRRLLKTTSTVLPSWPTTPAASTRPRVSTSRTSTTMTPSARARFWYTMERVRRLRATAWLSLAKSLVMSTTSAVSSATSVPAAAHLGDGPAAFPQASDDFGLFVGQELGVHFIDARLRGDGFGHAAVVPGQHDHSLDALPAQAGDHVRHARTQRVHGGQHAH